MNVNELLLDLQDHLETALEMVPNIYVSSKVGWSSDMNTSLVQVARGPNEKKCVELKVEYPIKTKIFTSFSDFSDSNNEFILLDKEMVLMLKRVKRMGVEYGIKKYLSDGKLTYIIRGFVQSELDNKSKEKIKALDDKKRMVSFWNELSGDPSFLKKFDILKFFDYHYDHVFRQGKLYIGRFYIRCSKTFGIHDDKKIKKIIDYLFEKSKDHPEFKLSYMRGENTIRRHSASSGLVISKKY